MAVTYDKGLREIADGLFAYLQPDGGWGWSNAGLLVDGDTSLLVDTLFDLKLTAEMLDAMAAHTSAAPIATVVNTHANGDHTYGNELVVGAEIISSASTAAEMEAVPPAMLAAMMKADYPEAAMAEYLQGAFGAFDFEGITLTPPTQTFSDRTQLQVGDRAVDLVEVGPAHTEGDVLAFVPDADAVFTGDILFIDGTPLMWAGPVANWVAACDLIIESGASLIVPGHGPLTDAAGVGRVRDYLLYVEHEARLRFDDGMSVIDAAFDIDLGEYGDWLDSERIVINVDTMYSHFEPGRESLGIIGQFGGMANYKRARG